MQRFHWHHIFKVVWTTNTWLIPSQEKNLYFILHKTPIPRLNSVHHVAGKIRFQVESVFTEVKLVNLILFRLNTLSYGLRKLLSLEKKLGQPSNIFGYYTWISIYLLYKNKY